ncbi:hypothetical protein KKE26_00720 [bacterium]|nr:hypothetical protein [bacterium]MBU1754238.1 hypothetical protein [bacterium]
MVALCPCDCHISGQAQGPAPTAETNSTYAVVALSHRNIAIKSSRNLLGCVIIRRLKPETTKSTNDFDVIIRNRTAQTI